MKISSTFIAVVCTAFLVSTPRTGISSGPWECYSSPVTCRMTRDSADILVLGKVIYSKPKNPFRKFSGRSVVVINRIERDQTKKWVPDELVVLPYALMAKPGELVCLPGRVTEDGIRWSGSGLSSSAAFQYVASAPPSAATAKERLAYFLKYVEHQDPVIAADAHLEFQISPFEDLKEIRNFLQRDDIHEWIAKSEISSAGGLRKGTYYLLLGLCEDHEDAEFLKSIILAETEPEELHLEISNAMCAYLLVCGDQGLNVLDQHKLQGRHVPFSETYAAMMAIEFMWEHGEGRISKDRLHQSMRILLEHPSFVDLVIVDLACWEDWKAMDQIVELYGQKSHSIPATNRAILRYLISAKKSAKETPDAEKPPHVIKAEKYLQQFRESDPKTVKSAERYFFD